MQQHKGEVTARSEGVGSGSTFEIRLPRIPRPSPATANIACFDSEPRRVLIVDDNADAADSLAMLLRFHNHQTHVVYGAKEALAAIEPFMPDVALIDIGLPQMNGYELAQRLRAMPKLSGVRLIAITGYGQSEDKRRVRAAGFDAHLVKPVNLMEVEHAFVAKAGDS